MADVAVASAPETVEAAPPVRWRLARRIAFRFLFGYLVLYNALALSFPPGGSWIAQFYFKLWEAVCPWVAIHIFGLSGPVTTYFQTGSGDTTLQYVQNFCYLVVALAATIVWSVLDRRRAHYETLHGWLRILVRYTLAFTMFGYGFAKVFPVQFRPANFSCLIEHYGDFSPMGVLWQFMGASIPYVVFSGAMEVLGGALLLFRRTTTLGALILCAVLANVVALNFCYDVPVKLYSLQLWLMSIFLLAPDLRRLFAVLILNRPTASIDLSAPRFQRRWLRIGAIVFQLACIGNVLYGNLTGNWKRYQDTYVHPKRQPLHGLWEVESFTRNGVAVPPLAADHMRWSKLVVDGPSGWSVRLMDDTPAPYATTYDAANHSVTLKSYASFTYAQPDPDHLVLTGTAASSPVAIGLRRIDPARFLLFSRGFHWISEYPFNR